MPDRLQAEIDRIAMEQGLAGTDDYLNQWHWTGKLERPGDPAEILDANPGTGSRLELRRFGMRE